MKTIFMKTDEYGDTCDIGDGALVSSSILNSSSYHFEGHPNCVLALDIKSTKIKNGYRLVSRDERERYLKPACALFLHDNDWIECICNGCWNSNLPYIVPTEFQFEPREPDARDIGKEAVFSDYADFRLANTEAYVGKTVTGKFCGRARGIVRQYKYAKIKDDNNECN